MTNKIFSMLNQKGGVGKTASCISLAAALSTKGKKVLLVDLDPQGDLSVSLNIRPTIEEKTVYEAMKGADIHSAIMHKDNFDVLPSDIRLSGMDLELVSMMGRETILKDMLQKVVAEYDYIFIDCPPTLSLSTLNALVACDGILIPVQAEYLALNGMGQLTNTISTVRHRLNPDLDIAGIFITRFDKRKNLSFDVEKAAREHFKDKVFDTIIYDNVSIAEAPSFGKDIFQYAPKSTGALNYLELADEFLRRFE